MKRALLISIALISVLLIVACAPKKEERTWTPESATSIAETSNCDQYYGEDISAKEYCYKQVGVTVRDESACEMITNTIAASDCYRELAEIKQDLTLCEPVQANVKDLCYQSVARVSNIPEDCLGISEEWDRWKCLEEMGIKNNDVEACTLSESIPRLKCFSKVASNKEDYTLCDSLSEQDGKAECYGMVAKAIDDISICDTLIEEHLISNCEIGFNA